MSFIAFMLIVIFPFLNFRVQQSDCCWIRKLPACCYFPPLLLRSIHEEPLQMQQCKY
nr:MAG TPA: Protealysin propeptide [Caudoviricetes sp.]DAN47629.1 MAG TPA: Protealysin propeptide [Caudoviricetes sp.]